MSYFYKLNQNYINAFLANVNGRFNVENIKSETNFLRSILREVTELFRKVGGQMSTKRSIPQSGDYPNAATYNALINDIGFDIGKLYNAQAILESDLVNVMNYNSTQRDKTFENLAVVQQAVYSAYIKSKKDIMGGTEVPTTNPFTSATGMDAASHGVFIDADRQCLTLGCTVSQQRIADTNDTAIYFGGALPQLPIYPLTEGTGGTLGVGSHWKIDDPDVHFLDQTNITDVETYKQMMVDDPTSNTSVGFCEFEAVETIARPQVIGISRSSYNVSGGGEGTGAVQVGSISSFNGKKMSYDFVVNIKKFIGDFLNLDPYLVYVDAGNSFQGKYIKVETDPSTSSDLNFISNSFYTLRIPFTQSVLTNQIVVEFTANKLGLLPNVDWAQSKVFSNVGGTESSYALIDPGSNSSQDGRFVCNIVNFTYPTRLELVLKYPMEDQMWSFMPFYMSHYIYAVQSSQVFPLSTVGSTTTVPVTVLKIYNIFVDAEANADNERTRALNVLTHPNQAA